MTKLKQIQNPSGLWPAPLDEGEQLEKKLDWKIKKILETLKKRHWCIGIMESCTGGAMVNCITNIPGASDVFEIGKVTYSIKAKIEAGVDEEIIKKYGVFSAETAEEMARKIEGEIGLGITGNMNDPAEVFVAVRIEGKIWSEKVSFAKATEHLNMNDKIEGRLRELRQAETRKGRKMKVVERVVEMISDNL